jgi:hypothetical protein
MFELEKYFCDNVVDLVLTGSRFTWCMTPR